MYTLLINSLTKQKLMPIIDLIMPKMGESIMEATILRWHKKVGDTVKQDETVLDIATDKVDSEVPSTTDGIITELLFSVNDVVAVGTVIAKVQTGAIEQPNLNLPTQVVQKVEESIQPQVYNVAPVIEEVAHKEVDIAPNTMLTNAEQVPFTPQPFTSVEKVGNNRFFSPLVLNIANSEGLSLSELERIPGTGADGRVSKKDVLQYIADRKAGRLPAFIPQQPVYNYEQPKPIQQPISTPEKIPVYIEQPSVSIEAEQPKVAAFASYNNEPIFIPKKVTEPVATPEPVVAFKPEVVAEPISTPKPVVIPEPIVIEQPAVITESVPSPQTVLINEPVVAPQPIVIPDPIVVTQPIEVPKPAVAPQSVVVKESVVVAEPVITPQPQPTIENNEVKTTQNIVHQSVFVPEPKLVNDVDLTTLAEINSGKHTNPQAVEPSNNTEIIEMDRMRKLIAKHMVDSVQTSPHVTSFVEADVTNMVLWREKVKADFEKREGTKLTFTPMFIDCLVKVMKHYPMINASVEGDKIIIKKYYNIGMATALPTGNLIVPVIKGADQLNIVGLSKAVNNLANDARNNQLKPDATSGGTFTLTNVGTFGSLMGTPIINQPQAAILAVGAIKKRPMVIESPEGDTIGIRHMMYLSLSYDHRIVDGSIGASFLTAVAKEFEAWNINRTWYQYV